MSLTGLDISKYQATTPALANYSFVFIRATYGLATDAKYAQHMAAARAAGIVAGSYHFGYSSAIGTPAAQAKHYLDVADASDLLVLDLESSAQPMTNTEARAFITAIHARGRQIGLYHSESGFPDLGQDWNWIASWDRTTFPPGALFWQYRGSPIDLDKFQGDEAALKVLVAASHIGDDMPGFKVTFPAKVTLGRLFLPKGTGAFRLSDSAPYTVPATVTRDAVTVVHVGGSAGYQVDLNGDEAHFVSPANPQFTPATLPPDPQALADAHAAGRESFRKDVEEIP